MQGTSDTGDILPRSPLAAELLNRYAMRGGIAVVVSVLGLLAVPAVTHGQDAQTAQPGTGIAGADAILSKIKIDRAGGVHITKLFSVVFGGIKQGSSMAAGPAISYDFADGSFVQVKGVYSIRNFKLLQARYDSKPLFRRRALISTRVRWQDAPELSLYPLGPDSPHARAEYAERKIEWSGFLRAGLAAHLNLTAGSGLERYALSAGFIDTDEDERLGIVPAEPGLATRPWFVHSFASLAYNTRFAPDYSRTGHAFLAGTHVYNDMHDGRESFHGFELAASQLIPTVKTEGNGPNDWKGALDLGGHAWMTETNEGSTVPFFLMPSLGGGDFLRGYPSYRFRDRNALLLTAEYRWAVHKMVDVAGLYEAGAVAPTVGGLTWNAMAQSAGGGIRVHSKSSALLRFDLARGRDGLEFSIGFNIGS